MWHKTNTVLPFEIIWLYLLVLKPINQEMWVHIYIDIDIDIRQIY